MMNKQKSVGKENLPANTFRFAKKLYARFARFAAGEAGAKRAVRRASA